jgi:hypothetical protein
MRGIDRAEYRVAAEGTREIYAWLPLTSELTRAGGRAHTRSRVPPAPRGSFTRGCNTTALRTR